VSESRSDRDWYEVTLTDTQRYYWTMTGDGSSDSVTRFNLALYDANGTLVDSGTNGGMAYTPTQAGTYYVQTGRERESPGQDGNYQLSMTAELTENADTEGRISAGQTVNGRAEYQSDRDWFQTSLQTGYSCFWTLAGDGSGDGLANFDLTLFNASGVEQADGDDLMTFIPTDAGRYFVQTGNTFNSGSSAMGNYQMEMVRETSGNVGTLARIGVNASVNDTLDYRTDREMYRTELTAGRTYDITMRGDDGIESLDRTAVGLYSANGTFLERQNAFVSEVTLSFTATQTGAYFINAGDSGFVSSISNAVGSYDLLISKGAFSGTAGNDLMTSTDESEIIRGFDGNDTIIGNGGDDEIYGGLSSADLRDNIFGDDGNDTIDGGYGNDELRGDAGNDVISGGFGADTVIGGTGNDVLTGGALGDLLSGGCRQ